MLTFLLLWLSGSCMWILFLISLAIIYKKPIKTSVLLILMMGLTMAIPVYTYLSLVTKCFNK